MSPALEGTCTVSQNVPSGLIVSILRCGKLSVRLSVCLSVSLSQRLRARFITYYIGTLSDDKKHLLLVAPKFSRSYAKFQGHTGQKKQVKRIKSRVFGHFLENAWGKGLKYPMLLYPDHWFCHGLLILLILVAFWLNETFQMCGFRIWWRTHDSNGLKFGMLIYPDYL